MAHKVELNVSEATLEQLCCSICKGYLSCPPLRVLPDGSTICGRCSPPDNDVQTYPQLILEAIMRDATFPCKFSQNGCKMRLPFGEASTVDHESECTYSNSPGSPKPGCSTDTSEQEAVNKSTIVLHNTELTVKIDGNNGTSAASESTVLNPFNVRKRKASIVSVRNWNGNLDSPRGSPSRANSWNGNFNHNQTDRNGNNYYQRDWRNTPPHRPWQPYNSYERNSYRHKRRNDLVVIKGHTIYITL